MADIIRADIEAVFGIENVRKWARLDNTNEDETARVTAACEHATEWFNARLRGSHVHVPVASPPAYAKYMQALKAGVWLYESRGVEEFDPESGRAMHRLQWHRNEADKLMRQVLAGQLDLGSPLATGDNGEEVSLVPSNE